jgi:A/G-specific adenine glycosylase
VSCRVPSRRIADALLAWYDRVRKPLPWRDAPSPYGVWVGEVMSQQTSLSIAADRFVRFTAELPDVGMLASCDEGALRRLWAGLGYYARARNLAKGASYIARELGGAFPEDAAGWRRVPGCGPYTAAVIASVCFGERVASVDGNAVRVASRLFAMRGDVWSTAGGRAIAEALGAMVLGTDRPGDLNQAVMELGQEICAKTAPRCGECPVASFCEAAVRGVVAQCPPRKPRKAFVDVALTVLMPYDARTRLVAIARRKEGFLADTTGFPLCAREDCVPKNALCLDVGFRHTITRHRLACTVAILPCDSDLCVLSGALGVSGARDPVWLPLEEAERRIDSSLDRKALAAFVSSPMAACLTARGPRG